MVPVAVRSLIAEVREESVGEGDVGVRERGKVVFSGYGACRRTDGEYGAILKTLLSDNGDDIGES